MATEGVNGRLDANEAGDENTPVITRPTQDSLAKADRASAAGAEGAKTNATVLSALKEDPALGDVYRVSPKTSPFGDAHGDNSRPAGVVELAPRVVSTLTRTMHPTHGARTLYSAANPALGLKEGWWSDHKPRPIARHLFTTAECAYLGPLPEEEASDLLTFWDTTKMLGRA